MEDVIVREYREGDEAEIGRLFNEVFETSRSLEEWHWKFRDNPAGVKMISVAEAAGAVVGHYANMVLRFRYRDRVVTVAMPVDNFIVPAYRGGMKGVQKRLFDFQEVFWDRLWFGFGFPNEAHYIVGKRVLHYKDVGEIQVLFKRLDPRLLVRDRFPWLPPYLLKCAQALSGAWLRASSGNPGVETAAGVRTRIAERFDERVDALWDRVKDRHKVICVRDRKYLDWRFRKPGADYRIVLAEKGGELAGYAVTLARRGKDAVEGYIVDVLADGTPGAASALVRRSVLELLSQKADFALCWRVPDTEVSRALAEAGFGEREDYFPRVHHVFYIRDPERADEAVIGEQSNWYVTMADSDTI